MNAGPALSRVNPLLRATASPASSRANPRLRATASPVGAGLPAKRPAKPAQTKKPLTPFGSAAFLYNPDSIRQRSGP
ncbi:hypothetical protein FGL97_16025 [Pseudomonas putida]|nr:hypothetical protein [Pseudomonas putida]NVN70090.1 hypothetical protein [Pseudomonas putida]